jgi:hypothetical protein
MALAPSKVYRRGGLTPLYPQMTPCACRRRVRLAANASYPAGTLLGELNASPGVYAAYNSQASDGTELARGILEFDCATFADGTMTIGWLATNTDETVYSDAPMFVKGSFATGDLLGLTEAAVAQLGRLIEGTVTSGVLQMS